METTNKQNAPYDSESMALYEMWANYLFLQGEEDKHQPSIFGKVLLWFYNNVNPNNLNELDYIESLYKQYKKTPKHNAMEKLYKTYYLNQILGN